jgi:hypothetical protein
MKAAMWTLMSAAPRSDNPMQKTISRLKTLRPLLSYAQSSCLTMMSAP